MSELHQALSGCGIYPDETERVDTIETHISRLYLTDTRVYKLKKPVDFGFCNFTSLDRRRFYCEEEVRLNRRLAHDSYLGVSKIVRQGDRFLIDRPGEICEYAVRMRRLPQERMLASLLDGTEQTEQLTEEVESIGRLLARFHNKAPVIDKAGHDDLRMMLTNWQQNFAQTRDCSAELIRPATLMNLEKMILRFMHDEAELFAQRQDLGYVRDGHGDLHSEHICLTKPPQIFDCIEFNPALRYGDILNDLAFLYMDLELRQRSDLAQRLWHSYQDGIETGPQAQRLLNFYALYRAWVRAKIHHFQAELPGSRSEHQRKSHDYFRLASSYALPQMLLLCCGLIGSGKTTLAQDLGRALGATVISSDQVRQGAENQTSQNTTYAQGRYSSEKRLAVYRMIADQVETGAEENKTLIVDATFENQQMRAMFLDLAKRLQLPCCFIEANCNSRLIRTRLARRAAAPRQGGESEARREHFERQRLRFEPLSPDLWRIPVDTSQPREYNVDFLFEKLLKDCGTLS